MGKRIGIPFPTKGENGKQSPAYSRCWQLVHKRGKPLAEAVDQVRREIEDGTLGHQKPRKQKDKKKDPIPEGQPEPIHEATLNPSIIFLERIEKKLDRTNTHLAEIARALNRIADREDPKPGMEGTVSLSSPPPAAAEKSIRATENGLVVGDRVKRIKSGEIGKITRILPGRNEVEIRFMLGSKTLPINQVQLMEDPGK